MGAKTMMFRVCACIARRATCRLPYEAAHCIRADGPLVSKAEKYSDALVTAVGMRVPLIVMAPRITRDARRAAVVEIDLQLVPHETPGVRAEQIPSEGGKPPAYLQIRQTVAATVGNVRCVAVRRPFPTCCLSSRTRPGDLSSPSCGRSLMWITAVAQRAAGVSGFLPGRGLSRADRLGGPLP
jgi:hypothetical protein